MRHFVGDVVAEPIAISDLSARAMGFLADAGVEARCAHHVALMLDEILTNVATHGGSPATPASVRVEVLADLVSAEILDAGAAFDPRGGQDPDLAACAADRPLGGVGLMLVRRIARELAYERRGSRNWTMFSVARCDPDPKGE
jgi:anti-sigma regulatory factor (Ser/Thr protein kinase)